MRIPRPAAPPSRSIVSWRRVEFAALDFETTGLDTATDAVVSFGVVPVRGGRVILGEAVHQLVEPHVPPSPRSQTIHELRPVDLAGSPSIAEARERLSAALDRRWLLAWFAEVEVAFLAAIYGTSERPWRRRTIDVRNLAIAADGEPRETRSRPGYALGAEARRRGIPVANPHEALDDAFVTAQLFLVLAQTVRRGREPTLRALLRAGRAEAHRLNDRSVARYKEPVEGPEDADR
jgi:DNA polymerase-3 subunit epsilon